MTVPRKQWRAERLAHWAQVDAWSAARLARRARGAKHPVDDFLFDYYPISPGKLRTWHPGAAAVLEGTARDALDFPDRVYEHHTGAIRLRPSWLADNVARVSATLAYLEAVHTRAAAGGCFALHEWAMVMDTDEVRHADYPLRVSQQQITQTIDDIGLRCTHFDAFRFFTPAAAPRNPVQLTRATQLETDQPGCLHANMDLYKHAVAMAPLAGSALVRQAFALARDIRHVDMQAAPYDLASLGVVPMEIETPEGRAQFAAHQRDFSQRAASVRASLIETARTALG